MSIIYGLVGRNATILAEYLVPEQGLFAGEEEDSAFPEAPKIARYILKEKVSKEVGPQKRSFAHKRHNFHGTGLCFMVVVLKGKTEESTSVRIPYKCIEEIEAEFVASCGDGSHASEGDLNDIFARVIKSKIEFWNRPDADAGKKTKQKVEIVKGQSVDIIDNVVKRGEAAEQLEERAHLLQEEATDLKMNAKTLGRKIWWKQKKCQIIAAVICIVSVIYRRSFYCSNSFNLYYIQTTNDHIPFLQIITIIIVGIIVLYIENQ